jgi:hypothetical protein
MFGFVYPDLKDAVPGWVTDELLRRLRWDQEEDAPAPHVCRGTLLSRAQYRFDIDQLHYLDERLLSHRGLMTPQEIEIWTAAVDEDPQR